MRLNKKSLERLRASNVTPLPVKSRFIEPTNPPPAPEPQPKPKLVAKETKQGSNEGEALRAIAEALKEQMKRQPDPVTFRFDITRGEDGKISGITATPVKS
jgi:hypothetical protein